MLDKEGWSKLLQHPNFSLAIKMFLSITALFILGLYIHAFFFFPINTDAGFYLAVVESLNQDTFLYRDILMSYTPLAIYLFNLYNVWTSNPTYTDYLLVIYIFNLLNAGWVYLLARKLGLNQLIAFGTFIITLGLFYKYEATFIVLEPFVLFFLLAATYFSLLAKRSDRLWIFVGFCVATAFLSKQYGLMILPALLYWIYKMGGLRYIWKLLWLFSLGFAIPIIGVLTYYLFNAGIFPFDLISIWFSSGGYGNFSMINILRSLVLFVLLSTPLILTFPLTLSKNKPILGLKRAEEKYFLLILFACTLLPLLFQQYEHYFLFVIPYALLLGGYMLEYRGKYTNWIQLALALNLMFFSVQMGRAVYHAIRQPKDLRNQQYEQARLINEVIPKNTKVVLLSYYHQRLNYLCHFLPADSENFGYTFPENLTNTQLEKMLRQVDTVITEEYDLETYPNYRPLLDSAGFHFEQKVGGIQIWIKK